MTIGELNYRLSAIFKEDITLLELTNQDAKKWYDKQYKRLPDNEFKENFIYGVSIDNIIQFSFKAAKLENVMRVFYTNFINKYLSQTYEVVGNEFVKIGKEKAKLILSEKIENERLGNYLSYSTNYGIGLWVFFIPKKVIEKCTTEIERVLKNLNIEYRTEYSDAGWVFRYIISGSYLDHNEIVKQFKF